RNANPTDVAVVDNGFDPHHEDLGALTLPLLCRGIACAFNTPADHGTHVAGTIGATFDNASDAAGFSIGVSGGSGAGSAGSPVRLLGIPWSFAGSSGY